MASKPMRAGSNPARWTTPTGAEPCPDRQRLIILYKEFLLQSHRAGWGAG